MALLLLAVAACERRPLEVITNEKVRVRILVKWKDVYRVLYQEEPTGMTVMLWGDKLTQPIVETTNDTAVTLWLSPDRYRVMIYNQTEQEFLPYLRFHDQAGYDAMTARNTQYVSAADGMTYTYFPDPIGVALDTIEITRDMVLQDTLFFVPYQDYLDNPVAYQMPERTFEFPEVPWPMTVNVYLSVYFTPRDVIRRVEGSLSGLAEGFYMSQVLRTRETAHMEFRDQGWQYIKVDDSDSIGLVTNETPSFGLPHGKELLAERDSTDNVLNLRVTLVNDSVINYTFNVGHNIRYITPQGREAQVRYRQDLQNLRLEVRLPEPIRIEGVEPVRQGAGFDAEVADWEDGGTISMGGF